MYKYKAFISYSQKDIKFARWLHKRIENYKIPKSLREKYPHLPKDLKRSIFRDEEELRTSSVLGDNLKYALDNSKKLIVICSPFAVASKWVNEEIRYFKEVHGEFSVLAIIKSGEPNALNTEEEAFPKSLRYVVGEDGELTDQKTEPLAGDARKGNNKEMALMKLIAGVLEVDFADLWEREKKEARKRNIIKGVIVSVILILGWYFIFNETTNSTNIELENFQKNRITIEYKLRHEILTEDERIKLYEVLDKLKESIKNKKATLSWLGKNKTEFLEHIEQIYNTKGVDQAIKELEANRVNREKHNIDNSKELVTLARLYIEKNLYQRADESFQNAIDEYFDYKNGLEYGNFLYKQNSLKKAIELYQKLEQKRLSKEKKALILNNIAILQGKLNQNHEAMKSYLKALKLQKKLADKNSSTYNFYVATTLNNLAMLQQKLNQYQEAMRNYKEALKLRRILADKNPSTYNFYVATTLNNLAMLQQKLNQNQEAMINYKEALKLKRELANKNPSAYNFDFAMTHNNLASLQYKLNQNQKAIRNYEESLKLQRALADKNPSAYNPDMARTLNNLAILQDKLNQNQKARRSYKETLKLYKALADKSPSTYGIAFANILVTGFYLFNTPIENLDKAETILNKFRGISNVEELLRLIEELRNQPK